MNKFKITFIDSIVATSETEGYDIGINIALLDIINTLPMARDMSELSLLLSNDLTRQYFYVETDEADDKILIYQDLDVDQLPLVATISEADNYKAPICKETTLRDIEDAEAGFFRHSKDEQLEFIFDQLSSQYYGIKYDEPTDEQIEQTLENIKQVKIALKALRKINFVY